MDLFHDDIDESIGILDEPKPPTKADPRQLGDRWLGTNSRFILLFSSCDVCKKSHYIYHFQILTDAQMLEQGWQQLQPYVWEKKGICSRECDQKVKKLKIKFNEQLF
jgi:hypothetical protein